MYKEDPVNIVYSQADHWIHLQQCFEKGILAVSKKRQPNKSSKEICVQHLLHMSITRV